MKLRWLALLCFAGCSQPSASTTSGGEAPAETPMVAVPSETSPSEGSEAANALGEPPRTDSNEPADVEAAPTEEAAQATATATTTTTPQPPPTPTVRPTTILAPARSGRVRLPAVHEVIREHRPEITECYQEGLSRDRSLTGVAKVRFLIGPRGRIENAEVYESSLHDEAVEQCILAAMREWRFPRPRPRGSSVLMTYPYSLATE